MEGEQKKIIEKLNLEPHPEGGFFKETYRSKEEISEECIHPRFEGKRNHSTCIFFLLNSESFSAFHRIRQDEIWHFYKGSPLLLHMIAPDGQYKTAEVGNDIENQQTPQLVVPAGHWFAANVINDNDYSLVGCTVSPGFDFRDFELAKQEDLIQAYPQHKDIIRMLTRD